MFRVFRGSQKGLRGDLDGRKPLVRSRLLCDDAPHMARHDARGRLDLDLPKAKLTKDSLREAGMLLTYLRPYRALIAAACCALVLSSLLSLCFPFLAGSLMDAATAGMPDRGRSWLPHRLSSVALLMLAAIAFQAACAYFHSTTMTRIGQSALADLRRDVYARLICLPMTFFGQRRVGELNSRLSADLTQIEATLHHGRSAVPAAVPVPARRNRPDRGHLGSA